MRRAYKVLANPLGGFNLLADSDLLTVEELRNAPGIYAAEAIVTPLLNRNIAAFSFMPDPRYDTEAEALADLKVFLDAKEVKLDPSVWED